PREGQVSLEEPARPFGPIRSRRDRGGRGHRSGGMTVTHIDEAVIRQVRTAVADGLTERSSAARTAGGRRLDADDEAALARRLIDDQLERHARDCIARN